MAGGAKGKNKNSKKRGQKDTNDGTWKTSKPEVGVIATDSSANTDAHGAGHHGNAVPPSSSTSEPVVPVESSVELIEEQKDEVSPAHIEGKEPEREQGIDPSLESREEQKDKILPTRIEGKEPQGAEGIDPAMPESNKLDSSGARSGGEGDSRGKAIASHSSANAGENGTGWRGGRNEGARLGLMGDGSRGRGYGGGPYGGQYASTRGRGGAYEGRAGGRGRGQGEWRTGGGTGADGRGGRGYGRDRTDGLGRSLVKILRHEACKWGLNIRSDGYVPVKDLLKMNLRTMGGDPLYVYNIEDVKEAVRKDNKQRFGLAEENGELLIRANQGHSLQAIDSEKLLERITSAEHIPVCVHGTYREFLDSICKTGLDRMTRRHIHFARGLPKDGDVISGMRGNCNILIYLDVEKALKDEMKIYLSENGVILTEGFEGIVSPKYFAKIERWPSRQPIDFRGK